MAAPSATTAAEALHNEEVERTRVILAIGSAVAAGAAAVVALTRGDVRVRLALLGGIALALAGTTWIRRELRDPMRYDQRKITALALFCVGCGALGILYTGLVSAAPLIVMLGLYLFCRTENRAAAIAVYALAAGSYALEAALVVAGVIDDPGFYPLSPRISVGAVIATHLVVQQMYAMCFGLARLTRQASLRSIELLQDATRIAAQREAQVAELRQDLDRALKIGGPGRFTGHVVGSWTLGNVVGRGAMGEVYSGTRPASDGEPVAAVKLVRRELLGDRTHVERFLREVRIAAALDSPHVVRVLEASQPEDPLPFLAMEQLHGQTLGEILREGGTLALPRAVELVAQIGAVLEQARSAGIVHRDLKPHNLLLTDAGVWKILDFGVALYGETSGTLTLGMVVGTPAYMPPEQARGETVDHRADLYALGAVLYRCLTGQSPFVASDTPSLLYAVAHEMPRRPSSIAEVPPDVEAFLAIALAKRREARFQSAAELVAAFTEAARGALSNAIRRRARAVLDEEPWNTRDETTQDLPHRPVHKL